MVLTVLVSPPFEPLESCDFKELTLRTVLLLALALGQRRSEIHTLSYSKVRLFEDSESLGMFPGFLTKNQPLLVPSSSIVVPSLKGENVDIKLCPVWALKIYLARVLPRRKNSKRLFIAHLEYYEKEISSDSISRWIVQAIKFSYESNSLEVSKVNAHEVRAWSSSWACYNKVPLDKVIKAGFWSFEILSQRYFYDS